LSEASLRISALSVLRASIGGDDLPPSKRLAESAKSEMWGAVRRVRLVGPEEVTKLAERLAEHYSNVDVRWYPPRGGSEIEDEFGRAARAAIEVPEGKI
jgi:hypothetical protein